MSHPKAERGRGVLQVLRSRFVLEAVSEMTVCWQVLSLVGHTAPVNSVAFSPDGLRVVSGSDDTLVKIWNATTFNQVSIWECVDGEAMGLSFRGGFTHDLCRKWSEMRVCW